jgi:Domain of unknown function (DUF1707)
LDPAFRLVGEVPVMARPGDEVAAGASHADREQVIEALKDAFVHGRLTKDELDTRTRGAPWDQTALTLADRVVHDSEHGAV